MLDALESAHILGLLDSAEYRKGKVKMKDSLKDVNSVFTPATEATIPMNLKTPEDVAKFMKANIRYSHDTRLKSAKEVLETGCGDCHSQATLLCALLSKIGIKGTKRFFVEYLEEKNGMTHTFVYYTNPKNKKIYWIENAWGAGIQGIIGPFNSLKDLEFHISKLHDKMPSSKHYPDIEFRAVSRVKPGMTLAQYVGAIYNTEIATEGIIFQKKPNVKNIEKWDTNPRDCILYAFTRVNNKSLDNLCNNHDREIVELDINDLDPWDGEMDEKIMDVRQSQYRDIYNALAKVPFIKELLTVVGKEKKELDGREVRRIDELHTNCCFVEGPTRAKLIKDIGVILRPLGSKYRFVLKGLDRRDIRLVSGLDTLPFVIRKGQ